MVQYNNATYNTTSPTAEFQNYDAASTEYVTEVLQNGSSGSGLLVVNQGSGTSFRVDDSASDTTPFIIDANGNVGVGESAPSAKLEVRQAGSGLNSANIIGVFTDTTGSRSTLNIDTNINPSTASTASYTGIQSSANIYGGASVNGASVKNFSSSSTYQATTGMTEIVGYYSAFGYFGSPGTLDDSIDIAVENTYSGASFTLTDNIGVAIEDKTYGTNKTNLLITTGNYNAAPVGNFSIYNSSTKDNYFAGNLGIGTTPSVVLDVTGSAVDVDQGVVGSLGGTLSSTTNDQAGYSIGADVTPGAASTQSYIGLGGYLRSSSSNVSGAELNGIAGVVQNTGTGTIGLAVGVVGRNALTSTGTISNSYALYAGNPINPFGTVGYNAGLYVEDITGGTGDNVGIEIAGADDYALYIGSGADNTDAANGITFGASADTNLYRGGSNLLQTDDALTIAGRLTIGAADTTGTLLVLDEKTNSGDPTGVAGAMYYNSNSGTFRRKLCARICRSNSSR